MLTLRNATFICLLCLRRIFASDALEHKDLLWTMDVLFFNTTSFKGTFASPKFFKIPVWLSCCDRTPLNTWALFGTMESNGPPYFRRAFSAICQRMLWRYRRFICRNWRQLFKRIWKQEPLWETDKGTPSSLVRWRKCGKNVFPSRWDSWIP